MSRIVRWLLIIVAVVVICFIARFTSDSPPACADNIEHFKYGSTGGERLTGIPCSVWMALPGLFPEYLPGGYTFLGFIYELGKDPIGVSKRRYQGIERVFFNCAICHMGSIREPPDDNRVITWTQQAADMPNLHDMLEPEDIRTKVFYRGYDVVDPVNVGFDTQSAEARRLGDKFDTSVKGNGNQGHLYGTTLPSGDKKSLLEYLKTL